MNYKKEIIKILKDEAIYIDTDGWGIVAVTSDQYGKVADRIIKLIDYKNSK